MEILLVPYSHLDFISDGFVEDVPGSEHLHQNSAIAEGVAYGSEPGSDDTECSSPSRVSLSNWHHSQDNGDVQQDGTTSNHVVQVGTAKTNNPGKRTFKYGQAILY